MSYHVKVLHCPESTLETSLGQPAAEGWQLISCWPSGTGKVTAVFQRPQLSAPAAPPPPPAEKKTKFPILPKDDALLDAIISICKDQEEKPGKDQKPLPRGVGLAKLAKDWKTSTDTLKAKLTSLGVKTWTAGVKERDFEHAGFFLWMTESGFVNISPKKKK